MLLLASENVLDKQASLAYKNQRRISPTSQWPYQCEPIRSDSKISLPLITGQQVPVETGLGGSISQQSWVVEIQTSIN